MGSSSVNVFFHLRRCCLPLWLFCVTMYCSSPTVQLSGGGDRYQTTPGCVECFRRIAARWKFCLKL